ncbi:MAG: enoyl-CoA hydratase/isomerase family protein [candidate division NC10 bacterium]|nr:enoyl-CoA hydratase/isomerase family protein [candidate division NC10 bacterium]
MAEESGRSMDAFEHLQVTLDDGVATVVLNRPRALNALSSQTFRELIRAMGALDGDPAVGAVLFTGAGERAFCAGSDLNETGRLEGEAIRRFVLLDFRCKARIAQCRKPTVAAIQGYALGGGLELALACDVRFAASTATLGFPEVDLGTVAGSGGIQRLQAVVGRGIAADLLFTGRKIGAQEAWRVGLVNYLCEPDQVLSQAMEYARGLAQRNPVAVQGTKAAMPPDPVLAAGQEAAYHSLLAQACRTGSLYRKQVEKFFERGDTG